MRDTIVQNIEDRFQAWTDLAAAIDDDLLERALPVPKSKSLKEHFWCVIGGRESYTKALENGSWSGFNCSLTEFSTPAIIDKLNASAGAFASIMADIGEWTPERDKLLASLLEHEAMHEGQVIRLMYGLDRNLPASWKWA